MNINLKPCPLCGEQAAIAKDVVEYFANGSSAIFPVVFCTGCGLSLSGDEHEYVAEITEEEIRELERMWNRRV